MSLLQTALDIGGFAICRVRHCGTYLRVAQSGGAGQVIADQVGFTLAVEVAADVGVDQMTGA